MTPARKDAPSILCFLGQTNEGVNAYVCDVMVRLYRGVK